MGMRVGIIGAMEVEVATLIALLEHDQPTTVSGMTFHEGILKGTDVVVVRCGVGKVNAAMCAQTIIDRFGATLVINTGIAGSLDVTLDIGDLVISTDAVQHDMDVTGLGYAPGFVPELGPNGELTTPGTLSFEADQKLADVVMTAAHEVIPSIRAIRGRIVSGDQFVCTQELRDRIIATFDARCCEMEGAAIAQVCWRNEVPFVVVRTISDKADGSSTVEYRIFEQQTAERCASIVSRALELLS